MPNKPALQEYIEGLVGGAFYVQVTQVTCTAAATKLMSNNFERMAAVFIDTGAVNVSVGPQNTVTPTMGIVLGSNGGSLNLIASEDLALVGYDWWGITSASSSTVTVVEIIRYRPGVGAAADTAASAAGST